MFIGDQQQTTDMHTSKTLAISNTQTMSRPTCPPKAYRRPLSHPARRAGSPVYTMYGRKDAAPVHVGHARMDEHHVLLVAIGVSLYRPYLGRGVLDIAPVIVSTNNRFMPELPKCIQQQQWFGRR